MTAKNKNLFSVEYERKSAVDVVVDCIKNLLISNVLKPGDLLPSEMELVEQLHVSRGSVREAMKILDSYGIIEIKRGDGTYISKGANKKMFAPLLFQILVNRTNTDSLAEVRELLELGINHLVIKNATDDEIAEIEKVHDIFVESLENEDLSIAFKNDIDFHRKMAGCCHNSIIENMYSFVIDLFQPSINPYNEGVVEAHRGIIKGLKERNEDIANASLKEHTKIWYKD